MFSVRNGSGCAEKWTSVSPWLQGCYRGVTRALQGYYGGVTGVPQGCFRGITGLLPG